MNCIQYEVFIMCHLHYNRKIPDFKMLSTHVLRSCSEYKTREYASHMSDYRQLMGVKAKCPQNVCYRNDFLFEPTTDQAHFNSLVFTGLCAIFELCLAVFFMLYTYF